MIKCTKQKTPNSGYHFTECGLDYVWLLNGYELELDEDGDECFILHNSDTLHQEIARYVVLHRQVLEAQEVRFLRSLLRMTQVQLADKLGVDSREVQRWENVKEKCNIGAGNDGLLRIMVWDRVLHCNNPTDFIEEVKKGRKHYEILRLMEASDNTWKLAA